MLDSLIQHYPNFEKMMRESLKELVGGDVEKKVEIGLAKDGSGVGGKSQVAFRPSNLTSCSAALCALQATKQRVGKEASDVTLSLEKELHL